MAELLTTEELAEKLKVSKITIARFRALGMPFKRVGRQARYIYDDVMKWLDNRASK